MTQDGGARAGFLGSCRPTPRPGCASPKRSTVPPALRAIAAITLFFVAICAALTAHAEAFDVSDAGWEGNSELLEIARGELGAARVQAVAVLNWDDVQPEDGVLAIHPLLPMDAEETTA